MFYDLSLTIPANTTKLAPLAQDFLLCRGVINRVEIGFPPGCAGLAHLQINRTGTQLWPTNPQGSFNTDSYTIVFDEHFEMFYEPYQVDLTAWNLDDAYPHTLELRIGIEAMPDIYFPRTDEELQRRLLALGLVSPRRIFTAEEA